ncbi:uncharacterized protein LACBIDRAFT_298907 [Laccaria bicolor S238N-H82]|uniref:Predicted protein n=1 Tax=Laccaria bicolor (strain S238N-H82 / ATCC MYA-4686) TaxID=486041 RepID=B0DDK3_LACBS|nr:uncharacterized protein LACBIDRAFT_298907 [Laccaria bicolor S238N-H82]EDR07231.1 predicted protein [Laccaria bicolor S238N-H82]|eukprot:XP_001882162.1 predicted protein [Laccaria bicolor S238N-H82]
MAMVRFKVGQDLIPDGLTLPQILSFVHLASALKNNIILVQPPSVIPSSAPTSPPPAICNFLADALGISLEATLTCWKLLKEEVWTYTTAEQEVFELEAAFHDHRWKQGIILEAFLTLYLPSQFCTNSLCARSKPLKKDQHHQAVVYTLVHRVQPAWSVHLSCQDCCTNYHNNFSVLGGLHTYYGGIPKYIQVGEHQFVENTVINMWITMMLVGWFSATNCARTYNIALSWQQEADLVLGGWQFGTTLMTEHVWDAFIIYMLLQDHCTQDICMQVPHTGSQKDRFTELMKQQ